LQGKKAPEVGSELNNALSFIQWQKKFTPPIADQFGLLKK